MLKVSILIVEPIVFSVGFSVAVKRHAVVGDTDDEPAIKIICERPGCDAPHHSKTELSVIEKSCSNRVNRLPIEVLDQKTTKFAIFGYQRPAGEYCIVHYMAPK